VVLAGEGREGEMRQRQRARRRHSWLASETKRSLLTPDKIIQMPPKQNCGSSIAYYCSMQDLGVL
jgi:hypothetical protein